MDIFKNIESTKDIKSLDLLRAQINEAFDKRAANIELNDRANVLSENSFGYIKEAFESLSPALFNTTEGKKLLKQYTEIIKGSKNLSSMHTLYENVRVAHKDTDVDFFLNELSETNWNVSKKGLSEDTKKMGKVLAEAYILLGKDCEKELPTDENKTLTSALEYIAENKKSIKNLNEYSDAIKTIRENIEQKTAIKKQHKTDLDKMMENLVHEFNKKYDGALTDDEVAVIKELGENKNHEELFNKYKNSCTAKLSEAKTKFETEGDTKTVKKLENIQEQIGNKKYNKETIGSDICNLMEITKLFL